MDCQKAIRIDGEIPYLTPGDVVCPPYLRFYVKDATEEFAKTEAQEQQLCDTLQGDSCFDWIENTAASPRTQARTCVVLPMRSKETSKAATFRGLARVS